VICAWLYIHICLSYANEYRTHKKHKAISSYPNVTSSAKQSLGSTSAAVALAVGRETENSQQHAKERDRECDS